jgi:DNA-binding MarR family transcriptional regulator
VRVALTAAGRQLVDAAFEELIDAERELLAPLGEPARGMLAVQLRALLAQVVSDPAETIAG